MLPGEQLIVHTAGAGGWGSPDWVTNAEDIQMNAAMPIKANGSVGMYSAAQNECD